MRVVVALETRFVRVGDDLYSHNLTYDRFWSRYLQVFDEVRIFGRWTPADSIPAGHFRATGPGVDLLDVPFYHGPWQFLKSRRAVAKTAAAVAEMGDAYILRVPGLMGSLLWKALRKRRRPYAVEVVGDPWEVFAPGGAKTPLRPLVRRVLRADMRSQCRDAAGALYVTKAALQRDYPCRGFEASCSSVTLGPGDFASQEMLSARIERYREKIGQKQAPAPWTCAHIGTMEQMYKRQDALIHALKHVREQGIDLRLTLVGDGRFRVDFEKLTRELALQDAITFTGRLPAGEPIHRILDAADVFLLPSLTEGLPRVVLEAMARGVPCLASSAGGTGELLEQQDMFEPRASPREIGERLAGLLRDPALLIEKVRRNHAIAGEYDAQTLASVRKDFYQKVAGSCVAAGARA